MGEEADRQKEFDMQDDLDAAQAAADPLAGRGRNKYVAHILKYFKYEHLPPHLQTVSKAFAELAVQVADRAPNNPETSIALRKLLEAKDAAVRAVLP